jgi:hypothetical protein
MSENNLGGKRGQNGTFDDDIIHHSSFAMYEGL